jgi:hypothetical protein
VKNSPEFELVNVDLATGKEDLLKAGTFEECQGARDIAVEEADENITFSGDIAYYPTMRIQAFQGW